MSRLVAFVDCVFVVVVFVDETVSFDLFRFFSNALTEWDKKIMNVNATAKILLTV